MGTVHSRGHFFGLQVKTSLMRFLLTLGVILMACWSDCRPFQIGYQHAGRDIINNENINGPFTINNSDRTSVHNHEENHVHQTIGSVEEYSGGGSEEPSEQPVDPYCCGPFRNLRPVEASKEAAKGKGDLRLQVEVKPYLPKGHPN